MISVFRNAMVGFALAMLAVGASAQPAKNPEIGTWKLNVEKSKFSPGPAPKSSTITVTAAGNGVNYRSKGVNSEGKDTGQEYTASYDGKDVPLTGSQLADTVSVRQIDANTFERVDKKAGKVVQTVRRVYSKDGKSFTATIKGTNAKGEAVNNTLLWERT